MVWLHYWKRKELIVCSHCKQTTDTPYWGVKHLGQSTIQEAYCSVDCENKHWLKWMRESGL